MRSAYHGGRADSRIVGRMLIGIVLLSVSTPVRRSDCQSPRAANPERPTVATHAYAVAPGYWELEQGFRAYGFGRLSEREGGISTSRSACGIMSSWASRARVS